MGFSNGEGRLSSLAIMHIKNDMPIDIDKVDNLFEGLHPRMMQLQSLLVTKRNSPVVS